MAFVLDNHCIILYKCYQVEAIIPASLHQVLLPGLLLTDLIDAGGRVSFLLWTVSVLDEIQGTAYAFLVVLTVAETLEYSEEMN